MVVAVGKTLIILSCELRSGTSLDWTGLIVCCVEREGGEGGREIHNTHTQQRRAEQKRETESIT